MSIDKKVYVVFEMFVDDLYGDKERMVYKFFGYFGVEDFLYGFVRFFGSDNLRYVIICRNVWE